VVAGELATRPDIGAPVEKRLVVAASLIR